MIKHKAIFVLTISRRCLIKYMHCINLLLLLVSWLLVLRLKCRIFTQFRVVFDRKSLIAFLLIFYWHKAQNNLKTTYNVFIDLRPKNVPFGRAVIKLKDISLKNKFKVKTPYIKIHLEVFCDIDSFYD